MYLWLPSVLRSNARQEASKGRESLFWLVLWGCIPSWQEGVVMGTVFSCGCRYRKLCVYIPMAQETGQGVGLSSKPQGPPPREPLSPARPHLPMVLQLPKQSIPQALIVQTHEHVGRHSIQAVTASLLSILRRARGMPTFYSFILFGFFLSLTNNFLSTKKCYSEGVYGKCYKCICEKQTRYNMYILMCYSVFSYGWQLKGHNSLEGIFNSVKVKCMSFGPSTLLPGIYHSDMHTYIHMCIQQKQLCIRKCWQGENNPINSRSVRLNNTQIYTHAKIQTHI